MAQSWWKRVLAGSRTTRRSPRYRVRPSVEVLEDRTVPSTIVWTNRGDASADTDNFNSVFGNQAEAARQVVDAGIDAWERVITAFNYDFPTVDIHNLTLSMSANGTGFGASAGITSLTGGKPTAGNITISRGTDTDGDGNGDGVGWFLDPTPNEHSEFLGDIVNAYAGDATPGGPADNLSDLYTIVVVEMTHTLGIASRPDLLLHRAAGLTIATGRTDDSEGGGLGQYFIFNGPSIDHLMTSNNGGANGQDRGRVVHSAGVGGNNQPVTFGGQTYLGAEDVGNAVYEVGRRYLVPNTMRLILQDAFGYNTFDPATFGTFYAALNESTGEVLVRGGSGDSSDQIHINVNSSNQRLLISVDVGNDVPGTGPFSGAQNLPAFVTSYSLDEVNSIRIESGGGGDTITIHRSQLGTPITINAGSGNDVINVGAGDFDTNIDGDVTVNGGSGADTLTIDDTDDGGADSYTVSSSSFIKPSFGTGRLIYSSISSMVLHASNSDSTIRVNSLNSSTSLTVNGRGGRDAFFVGNLDFDTNIDGDVTINGGAGADTLTISDSRDGGVDTYTITDTQFSKNTGTGSLTYSSISSLVLSASDQDGTIRINSLSGSTALTVNGNRGRDTFVVGAGDFDTNIDGPVTIDGGSGDDVLYIDDRGDVGADTYTITDNSFAKPDFGTGSLTYQSISSLSLDANDSNNTIRIQTTTAATVITVHGNRGNDTLLGGAGDDVLFGDEDDDTFSGGPGTDIASGGGGNDTADATVEFFDGGPDQDGILIKGTDGNDDIRVWWEAGPMVMVNVNGQVTAIPYANGEVIIVHAGKGDDQVVMAESGGMRWEAWFHGEQGDDVLIGSVHNDRLFGGAGNDILKGGGGDDLLEGGQGHDRLEGGDGEDELKGGRGHDWLWGGGGDDRLFGGAGHDALYGDDGDDALDGGAGHDRLLGGEGDDELVGGAGSDLFRGGAGADRIRARDGALDFIFADRLDRIFTDRRDVVILLRGEEDD